METEKRLVKLKEKKGNGLFLGMAEAMLWDVKLKNAGKEGDIVLCDILHDEERDEFFLEESLVKEEAYENEQNWKEQEREYI